MINELSRSLAGATRALQKENEDNLRDTAGSLKHATKSLTRSLQENVDLQGNMNKMYRIGHELHQLLSITVGELMDLHTTTLDETTSLEHERRTNMEDTIKREKKLSVDVAELRSKLATERMEMETEIGLKDLKLAGLLLAHECK
jgi:hypothetical protein